LPSWRRRSSRGTAGRSLASLAGRPLDDDRVSVFEGDVSDLIDPETSLWDAIVVDADNGPEAFPGGASGWLYGRAGLAAAFGALRPGGVLAVWPASSDRAFTRRFRVTGFRVEDHCTTNDEVLRPPTRFFR
jgi:spermidine synthase